MTSPEYQYQYNEVVVIKQQLNDRYGKGAIFMDNPNVPRNEVGDESNIDLLQEHLNQYSKDIDSFNASTRRHQSRRAEYNRRCENRIWIYQCRIERANSTLL
jgi:hypothetical protein